MQSPFSYGTRQRLLFLFFWGGVYADYEYGNYAASTYPFFTLLMLLTIERLSQLWVGTRFGCDDKLISQF